MNMNNVASGETEKKSLGKVNKGKRGMKRQEKGIKVVYIGNPMKVKTSASEFRALVQQLTGQYAQFPAAPTPTPTTTSFHADEEVKIVGSDQAGEEEAFGDEWMMLASDCSFLTTWPVSW